MSPFEQLPADLAERIARLDPTPKWELLQENNLDSSSLRPAAVLMPLLFSAGQWHLLYTRRSDNLINHRGQVAFPGGGWEVGDDDLESTALRETWEEIGVRPEHVQVLGKLPALGLISHYLVTPVVGMIPWPYDLHVFATEVARVFSVPLAWLANQANFYTSTMIAEGKTFEISYYQLFDGEKIWGATAHMTHQFLHLLQ